MGKSPNLDVFHVLIYGTTTMHVPVYFGFKVDSLMNWKGCSSPADWGATLGAPGALNRCRALSFCFFPSFIRDDPFSRTILMGASCKHLNIKLIEKYLFWKKYNVRSLKLSKKQIIESKQKATRVKTVDCNMQMETVH